MYDDFPQQVFEKHIYACFEIIEDVTSKLFQIFDLIA